MDNNIRIKVGSDTDFEDLVADVEMGKYHVCSISQEEGFNNLKIHIPIGIETPLKIHIKDLPTFDLKEFEKALKIAKERLWELRKTG